MTAVLAAIMMVVLGVNASAAADESEARAFFTQRIPPIGIADATRYGALRAIDCVASRAMTKLDRRVRQGR